MTLTLTPPSPTRPPLTPEQERIVEFGDGPLVVIAGAGTGKTRVIVERCRWLLETKGAGSRDADGRLLPAEPQPQPNPDHPFSGPLLPEQLLVLTYNVKAARELETRLDEAVGPATRARMTVSNFHSFCHRILSDSAGEAGMPPNPDVLDGVGQLLLLRDLQPALALVYHSEWQLQEIVSFINRAKDELVTPGRLRRVRGGGAARLRGAVRRLRRGGRTAPDRGPAGRARARCALTTRASASRSGRKPSERPAGAIDPEAMEKTADREARRYLDGHGHATPRSHFPPEVQAQIDELAATYVRDGAALEVMRLQELAAVYRAYQVALVARGALDFGEQIAAATQLFKTRPNILRRWQRQFRYILVDEFQDANIAQIELIELLGRTPDRPDNVMVVGDDDQSIYRFRGASFAAFTEFDRRFSRPPIHDPDGRAPGPPPRLRIEQNFRSIENVLTAANRLIGRNAIRFEPDKRLRTEREVGPSVELIVCAGPEDEAVAIVDAIRARLGEHPRWSDVAILYRKHKHREALVARLRDEDIPYTVVGGLSLFATPEIRDLEQGLRAIADPEDDVALTRMMTAGPWRLDALEILRVARTARFDRRHLLQVVREIVGSGRIAEDRADEADEPAPTQAPAVVAVAPATQAKLRRLLGVLDELQERAWRDGPLTILDRYLELGGQVLDMMAVDTTDAHRIVANIASFMRFAADWQSVHPTGTLAEFVDYLGAYQDAGGELPTSVELTEDVEGVRLMTVYQAKGLEFRHVFVPCLLEGEWPTREGWRGYFPTELLREAVPEGDIHTEEERRLLYVAMTRAQETLTLTTQVAQAPGKTKSQSLFIAELLEGAGPELLRIDRTGTARCRSRRRAMGSTRPKRLKRRPRSIAHGRSCAGSCRCRRSASGGWRCGSARPSWSGSWKGPGPPTPRRRRRAWGWRSSSPRSGGRRRWAPTRRGRPAWTR